MRHLLLIGAYRDNEVSPAHPLMRTLEAIRKAGARYARDRACAPRARRCRPARGRFSPLRSGFARILWRSWCTRRLAAIRSSQSSSSRHWPRKGCSRSTTDAAAWTWDLARIRAKGYTDNVVDLMVGEAEPVARRDPASTQATRLSGERRRDRHPDAGSRGIGGGDPRGALGGCPRGVDPPPGQRLRVPPRPRSGGGLCAHP